MCVRGDEIGMQAEQIIERYKISGAQIQTEVKSGVPCKSKGERNKR